MHCSVSSALMWFAVNAATEHNNGDFWHLLIGGDLMKSVGVLAKVLAY